MITHEQMMDVTVLAESTPGPIAINCATFTGYKQAGFLGALAATVGIVLPSFLVIFAISAFLDDFLAIKWVASAFLGIKAAVGLLIVEAGIDMARKMPKKPLPLCIMLGSLAALLVLAAFSRRVSSIVLMLAAALISLAVFCAGRRKGGHKA